MTAGAGARLVVAACLLLLLAGVWVAGARSDHRQLGSNLVDNHVFVADVPGGGRLCQSGDTVPAGTSAVRLTIGTYDRPAAPLALTVHRPGRSSSGGLPAGWQQGSVVVPLETSVEGTGAARVCLRNAGEHPIAVAGAGADAATGLRVDGQSQPARIRLEWTTVQQRSYWSMVGTLADRMTAVRVAFPGSATLWLWAGLVVALVAGVAWLLLRPPARAGAWVTLLGLLSALAWSLVIPPFHVPDEMAHVYYASYLVQTGEVPGPTPDSFWYSHEMNTVLTSMAFPQVVGRPYNRPPWTAAARAEVQKKEDAGYDAVGRGDAAHASSNSPAYYALQGLAWKLSPSPDLTDRLAFMRLLSVVISALTVGSVFLFVREVLPTTPWAATAGALAVALQPMFGFISSGVNNDGLLYLCSALLLLGVARAFRRGLAPGNAALVGGALAVGTLVKTQLIAFVPAVGIALLLLLLRERRVAWRPVSAGLAALAAPLLVYFVLGQTVWDRPVIDRVGGVTSTAASSPELRGMLSYVWQSYLPRPPFLHDWFPGYPLKNLWIEGLIGRFGWLDYGFPRWFYTAATLALGVVGAAAGAVLVRERASLRRRAGEAFVYLLAAVTLAVLVAVAGYLNRLQSGLPFEQARYLLPLIPLYAVAVGLAVRAAGRRHTHVLAALVVGLALIHAVFGHLLTVARYYG